MGTRLLIKLMMPLLATLAGGAVIKAAAPDASIDITSLLVQVPLVFLVVWIINTRDKQWRDMISQRDTQWQSMLVERDTAWRQTITDAHTQGIESVGKALGGIGVQLSENNKVLSANAARLETLVQARVREARR